MESERPHRTKSNSSSGTSELFICFSTSRLSSASMKLSSKSILSPGRAREPSQISLSTSLSRRLRTSGSIKGGQASPMFPSGSKKRGCGFENPEPSSPKVTCIGQVRVKTKKQGKKMRMIRSKRRGAEASFRKAEQNVQTGSASQQELLHNRENFQGLHFQNHQISNNQQQECLRHRNQRWVHLPLTICEALRAFGSEFNCFVPNRSSCMASDGKEKVDNKGVRSENGGSSSCGAVFASWFVALQDGDGKGREIELVVGEEERTERSSSSHSQRRQVFEGIEFKEEKAEAVMEDEEEAGRVSICVPPKNALLLMRCRSDPVKMAALANRFWEMPAPKDEEVEDEEEDEGHKEKADKAEGDVEDGGEVLENVQNGLETEIVKEDDSMCEKWVSGSEEHEDPEEQANLVLQAEEESEKDVDYENPERRQQLHELQELEEEEEEKECQQEAEQEEELGLMEMDSNQPALAEDPALNGSLAEVLVDPEKIELEENGHECEATDKEQPQEQEEEEVREVQLSNMEEEPEEDNHEEVEKTVAEAEAEAEAEAKVTEESTEEEKENRERPWEAEETVTRNRPEPEYPNAQDEPGSKRGTQSPVLPDCLLLMMCEPKLSMEVSKETWVCKTDFIRCLPERHVSNKKTNGSDEAKKRVSFESKPAPPQQQIIQPPRSSCSFPVQAAPVSMAAMIGQKLVGSNGYEPFVLTRCKSEPMRSASKLAAPENCFWKNRKLEPHHRPGALGVGATGVGF